MTKLQRVFEILKSLLIIILAVIMLLYPIGGYTIVLLIIELGLLIYGIRLAVYYFTMTRYKVGGLSTLYKSILVIDIALLLFSLPTSHPKLVMTALIIIIAFDGVVYIMKAMKSKTLQSSAWKTQLIHGLLLFILAVVCFLFIGSWQIATVIFSIGMIISAVSDIINACTKTAILYIG